MDSDNSVQCRTKSCKQNCSKTPEIFENTFFARHLNLDICFFLYFDSRSLKYFYTLFDISALRSGDIVPLYDFLCNISAKPEQENLNELKQELDVDFHKVNIYEYIFIFTFILLHIWKEYVMQTR
jgi:hypothetical protein